jgi:hypothetical protein
MRAFSSAGPTPVNGWVDALQYLRHVTGGVPCVEQMVGGREGKLHPGAEIPPCQVFAFTGYFRTHLFNAGHQRHDGHP